MLRRRLRIVMVVTAAVAVGLLGTVAAPPASAQDEECRWEFRTGPDGDEVVVWVCSGDGQSGGGNGEWTCHVDQQGQQVQVPCIHDPFGWFSTIHGGCYIKPASPQPDAGDPAWDGHDPSDGVVYTAACFAVDGVDGMPYVHLPTNIFLSVVDGPFADLLEEAIALLGIRGPDIHLAPDPSGVGLVGLPVWMWTPETGATWGPLPASLTALGVTLRVEANADQVRWEMGDGGERICRGPGTAYEPEFGADESPTCGYAYTEPSRSQPGGRYEITATTEWHIDWEIDGTAISGTEIRTRESSASVRINELQVVTS